jgi:hypothetical protein
MPKGMPRRKGETDAAYRRRVGTLEARSHSARVRPVPKVAKPLIETPVIVREPGEHVIRSATDALEIARLRTDNARLKEQNDALKALLREEIAKQA